MLRKLSCKHLLTFLKIGVPKQQFCQWHSQDIRHEFVNFFKNHNHKHLPSSSLAPIDDKSLIFTNAGMNQFKTKFLNTVDPNTKLYEVKRAVTYQKCIRVGGKHNDLNDVGYDTTHHTFFEMLGSWSFGDYFKKEACEMALELLTKVYKIPQDRLYVTYFGGNEQMEIAPDIETKNIWKNLNFPDSKIIPFGANDNFWEMGQTGPCGPCTEIHYDFIGKRDASHLVNQNDSSVVELWNIVFVKYNRLSVNNIKELVTYHIDTGMGLERLACILQGKKSNYDTDLFLPIIQEIQNICSCPQYEGSNNEIDIAYRVISDHMRMVVMSISDSICPGPHGAPLLVRQVLQRALYAAEKLCASEDLLPRLVSKVIYILKDGYPILEEQQDYIKQIVIEACETHYKLMQRCHGAITRTLVQHEDCRIDFPVQVAVTLCNRFRLPRDLFTRALQNYNVLFDNAEFNRNTEALKELTKRAAQSNLKQDTTVKIPTHFVTKMLELKIQPTCDDSKYELNMDSINTHLVALIDGDEILINKPHMDVIPGKIYGIILNETNMYATNGGQISDTGFLQLNNKNLFIVTDVTSASGYVVHHGTFNSEMMLNKHQPFLSKPSISRRKACMRAHSAAHLLNFAVSQVMKRNVEQDGQKVKEDMIVYGFACKFSPTQIAKIEKIVRANINKNHKIYTTEVEYDKIKSNTAVRKLNMPYPNVCRVVSIGTDALEKAEEYPIELCGGTHVEQTSDIIDFYIKSSQSRGANLTRITCLTGDLAEETRANIMGFKKEVGEFINVCKDQLDKNQDVGQLKHTVDMTIELQKQANRLPTVMKLSISSDLQNVKSKLNKKIRKLHRENLLINTK